MHQFATTDSILFHRNGRTVTIQRTITEPEPGFDAESLPMHRVRFADGFETDCWPDELTELAVTVPEYRDAL